MPNRPIAPKGFKNDGDDIKGIVSAYKSPEYSLSKSLSVILMQLYDISDLDGLDVKEMKLLLANLVDDHFTDVDLAETEPYGKDHPGNR